MKAKTIINKIIEKNSCSIHTAKLLSNALHREGYLHEAYELRYRLLLGTFDFVNQGYEKFGAIVSVYNDLDPIDLLNKLLDKNELPEIRVIEKDR